MKKDTISKKVKLMLDILFWGGIVATATLPVTIYAASMFSDAPWADHYLSTMIIFVTLGVAVLMIVRDLRKMFRTVINKDCFVKENVASLRKMTGWSVVIVVLIIIRCIIFITMDMALLTVVFAIVGLFSMVLSFVFEEAIKYKEDNNLIIECAVEIEKR